MDYNDELAEFVKESGEEPVWVDIKGYEGVLSWLKN